MKKILVLFLLSSGLIGTTVLNAQKPGKQIINELAPKSILKSIDAEVLKEMARQNIVGCAVGVMQNGVITHLNGYGHKDLLRTQPISTSTVFEWGSISKTITAVAAFKAMQEGKMNLNSLAGKLAPYWPGFFNKDKITIEHLLQHRSGILHYGLDPNKKKLGLYFEGLYTAVNNFNANQCVNVFSLMPLFDVPGKTYCYTSFGYNLLGACIEEATHTPYETYVTNNIKNIAGMTSLSPYAISMGGYTKNENQELLAINEGRTEWKLPGGGWSSNITDLAKFMCGLANNSFLKNTDTLWSTILPNSQNYGYGIVKSNWDAKVFVNHGGAEADVRTFMGFYPRSKTGVCVMINGGDYINASKLSQIVLNAIGQFDKPSLATTDYVGDSISGAASAGVWRAATQDEAENTIIRQGYTTDEFGAENTFMNSAGYYADNIETFLDGSTRKWNGIFKKKTSNTALWRNCSFDIFHDKWVEMNNKGKRLIDLEAYKDGNETKFAGTFIQSSDRYALFRGLNIADLANKHIYYSSQNYQLIDVENYMDGSDRKWCGVWKGDGKSILDFNLTSDYFTKLCTDREVEGYKLVDIETYLDKGTRKWAGVWVKKPGNEKRTFSSSNAKIILEHNINKAANYVLVDLQRYEF